MYVPKPRWKPEKWVSGASQKLTRCAQFNPSFIIWDVTQSVCSHQYHLYICGFCDSDGKESAMQETWLRSLGQEDPLEKEMAIHSSILAWRIPWTEEPGRLQSTGLQRVGHDWVTSLCKWYHSNARKRWGTKEPLDEGERGEWNSWFKTQHWKNEDHGI